MPDNPETDCPLINGNVIRRDYNLRSCRHPRKVDANALKFLRVSLYAFLDNPFHTIIPPFSIYMYDFVPVSIYVEIAQM